MTPERPANDCGDESARLLAWFVNGTLGPDDARRVSAHLQHCASCRDDAARLQTVQTLLRAPSAVEYAPQAGLRKLVARVEQEVARDAATSAAKSTAPQRWPVMRSPARWLAAAVVVQACAIVAIVAAGVLQSSTPDAPAAFRTLTSPSVDGPRLRVVFALAMTLGELQDLLRANQLVAVAGPSDAGMFTLALQAPAASEPARAAVVVRLRADARVRFAEAVGTEPVGR